MIQTGRDNQRRRDFRRGGDKKESCSYCRGKGKHESLESCLAWGERCEKCGKENPLRSFGNKKYQLYQLEFQKSHPTMSRHTLSKRKLRTAKQKRSDGWRLY